MGAIGRAQAERTTRATACIALVLVLGAGCGGGSGGDGNHSPVIDSLAATPPTVSPGGAGTITADASDADGDSLAWEWLASAGVITGTGHSVTWTAPSGTGTYTITCTVLDGKGGATSKSLSVTVSAVNHDPVIQSLVADPTSVAPSGTSTVTCQASDLDNDPLIYQWAAPGASFTGSGPSVTWKASSSAGTFDVTCTVRDGRGGTDTETVSITVASPNHSPVIQSLLAQPNEVGPGGNSTVTCTASDPDGDPLTYEWSASDGSTAGSGASVAWTAPDVTGTYSIECTVSDGRGGSRLATVTIYVTASVVVVQ